MTSNTLLTLTLLCAFLNCTNAEAPKKKFYFEDSKRIDLTITVRADESVIIVFSDINNEAVKLVSWVNLISADPTKNHDAKIDLNLLDLTSKRYEYVWPEIGKDVPEDLKKEYEAGMAKINSNFKRAEYILNLDWQNGNDTQFQGGYLKSVGANVLEEVVSEKIGKMLIDEKGGILKLEIPLVTDPKKPSKLQIFKGNTKSIEGILKEMNILDRESVKILTLSKK